MVKRAKLSERVYLLKKFVNMAEVMIEMNNFSRFFFDFFLGIDFSLFLFYFFLLIDPFFFFFLFFIAVCRYWVA